MTLPLPDGFVDTGVTVSVSAAGSLSLWGFGFGNGTDDTNAYFLDFSFQGRFSYVDEEQPGCAWSVSNAYAGVPLTEIATATFSGDQCATPKSPFFDVSRVIGPFRLGVRYVDTATDPPHYPAFAQMYYRQEYSWFADDATMITWTCTGVGSVTKPYSYGTGNVINAGTQIGEVSVSVQCPYQSSPSVCDLTDTIRFRNLTVNGLALDTTGLTPENSDGVMQGAGAGAIDCTALAPCYAGNCGLGLASCGGISITPPWQFTYDLGVSRFGARDIGAHVDDAFVVPIQLMQDGVTQKQPQRDYLTTPDTESFVVPSQSWETHNKTFGGSHAFSIRGDWASTQDPSLPGNDLYLPIAANPALSAPSQHTTYRPITVALAGRVGVQRPDGTQPSDWVSSDTGKLAVSEGATASTLAVTQTGANITRTLVGTDNWRSRITPTIGEDQNGNPVNTSPTFAIDNYEVCKHNWPDWNPSGTPGPWTGEDVWWWGTYGFLEIDLDVPVAGTLSLTVSGCHLAVSDPHTTGSDRLVNYSATEVDYSHSYSLPVEAGANVVTVDLLFPTGGGPVSLSRILSLTLSGFAVGTYTINDVALVAKSDAYLKVDFGAPVSREGGSSGPVDFSALVASLDGAQVLGNWGDQAYKPEETGAYGGGVRYVTILTGSETGVVMDSEVSLAEFAGQFNKLEGWAVTYSQSASDAANKDAFGAALGPELAQWMRPIIPHQRIVPDQPFTPDCNPLAASVGITNMVPYVIYAHYPQWGALETLTVGSDGKRGRPGAPVTAVRVSTGAAVAAAVTDRQGYATVAPIPANETEIFGLGGATVALKPHDRVRLDAVVSPQSCCDGLFLQDPLLSDPLPQLSGDGDALPVEEWKRGNG